MCREFISLSSDCTPCSITQSPHTLTVPRLSSSLEGDFFILQKGDIFWKPPEGGFFCLFVCFNLCRHFLQNSYHVLRCCFLNQTILHLICTAWPTLLDSVSEQDKVLWSSLGLLQPSSCGWGPHVLHTRNSGLQVLFCVIDKTNIMGEKKHF